MTLARAALALPLVCAAAAAGFFGLVPRAVERTEIAGEETCPAVMLVGAGGAALRVRPLGFARRSLSLPEGAVLYLCETRGDWLGVVAPAGHEACRAAARDAASPLPEDCPEGWVRREAVIMAAG